MSANTALTLKDIIIMYNYIFSQIPPILL